MITDIYFGGLEADSESVLFVFFLVREDCSNISDLHDEWQVSVDACINVL